LAVENRLTTEEALKELIKETDKAVVKAQAAMAKVIKPDAMVVQGTATSHQAEENTAPPEVAEAASACPDIRRSGGI
jgi:fructose-bisphosphate aldolase class 1